MEKTYQNRTTRFHFVFRIAMLFGAVVIAFTLLYVGFGMIHVQSVRASDALTPLNQIDTVPPGGYGHGIQAWKMASQHMLFPGELLTYTIFIQNMEAKPVTTTVSDPVPAEVVYQDGSVSSGGLYDPASQTLLWENVVLPAYGKLWLNFAVAPLTVVVTPTLVTNTATITAGSQVLQRNAWVVLAPESWICPMLGGSFKIASSRSLAPTETLTYTIVLYNNGHRDTVADVTDPLPAEVAYISGTVIGGGAYDAGSHAMTWSGVNVPAFQGRFLSFGVTQAVTVSTPTLITNTAVISSAGKTIERQTRTLLLPANYVSDDIPPRVESVLIDEQDVLTVPTVTLHISATDNMSVTWMYIREWRLFDNPKPFWKLRYSSGWLPYQPEYTWTLKEKSGVHFVGVWVADAAYNRSHLTRDSIDFASLILPGETVPQFRWMPYLVNYTAGEDVQAVVTPTVGNADLFVWYPRSFGWPDQHSAQMGTASEVITFTTPISGPYIFLVYGREETTYDMSITPGGGPGAWNSSIQGALDLTAPQSMDEPGDFLYEPLFTQSGSDVLGAEGSDTPGVPRFIYLPMMAR